MLDIKRILVSQPKPIVEKNPFSDVATKFGVVIDFHPLVQIEVVTLKEFRAQRVEILDHDAIIFTSKMAIDHFFAMAEQVRVAIPEAMKYFCISEAVALYLQKYIVYRKRKIFFAGTTFDELVEVLTKHKELKYLFPLNDQCKPELLAKLSKQGIKHNKVILSHTVASNLNGVDINSYDMAALYSQAEVRAFCDKYNGGNCKIATFGVSTSKAAIEAGLEVDLAVPTCGLPSIATGIDKYLTAILEKDSVDKFAFKNVTDNKKACKNISTAARSAK